MDNMVAIAREEVRKYASPGLGITMYAILDDQQQYYSVLGMKSDRHAPYAEGIAVFARVENEYIIIEVDNTDKQLVDALLQQGIPREKIILAYRGETLPKAVPSAGD